MKKRFIGGGIRRTPQPQTKATAKAKQLADDNGLSIRTIIGTGKGGIVTVKDVKAVLNGDK